MVASAARLSVDGITGAVGVCGLEVVSAGAVAVGVDDVGCALLVASGTAKHGFTVCKKKTAAVKQTEKPPRYRILRRRCAV